MLNFLRKTSSKVAVMGATSNLDDAEKYIITRPHERKWVLQMSYDATRLRLLNDFGIILSEQIQSPLFHTYDYHVTANNIKREKKRFSPYSPECAAANLMMACFSILGSDPYTDGRKEQWRRLFTLWNNILYEPEDENEIMAYDAKTGRLWVRD